MEGVNVVFNSTIAPYMNRCVVIELRAFKIIRLVKNTKLPIMIKMHET